MAARQPDLVLSYTRIGPIYFPYCGNVLAFARLCSPALWARTFLTPLRLRAFASSLENRVARARGMAARFDRVRCRGRPRRAPGLPSVEVSACFRTNMRRKREGEAAPRPPFRSHGLPLSFAPRSSSNSRFARACPFGRFGESHEKSYIANPIRSVFVLFSRRLQNCQTQLLNVQSRSPGASGKSAVPGKSKFGIAVIAAVNLQVILVGPRRSDLLL